jgi:hypothetical protein
VIYRKIIIFGALVLFMATISQTLSGQDVKNTGQGKKKEADPVYAVLMITDTDKSVSFVIASGDDEKTLKLDFEKSFKESMKNWEAAKKEAMKNKLEFSDPKPLKPQIKILKKGLKKDEAETIKQKAEEEFKNKNNTSGKDGGEIKYAVIQIKDMRESVSFEIIEDNKASDRIAGINKEYQISLKNWEKARIQAKNRKAEFYETKPAKPSAKVLKRGLSKDKAQEVLQKAQADQVKKSAGAASKKKNRK